MRWKTAISLCFALTACDAEDSGPEADDPGCVGAKCDAADDEDDGEALEEPAIVLRFDALVQGWLCELEGLCDGFDRKRVLISPNRRQIEIFYSGFVGDDNGITARVELQHEGDDFESEADFGRARDDQQLYGFGVDVPADEDIALDPSIFDVEGGLVDLDAFNTAATDTERSVARGAIDAFVAEVRQIFDDPSEWDAALAFPLYDWTAADGVQPLE